MKLYCFLCNTERKHLIVYCADEDKKVLACPGCGNHKLMEVK